MASIGVPCLWMRSYKACNRQMSTAVVVRSTINQPHNLGLTVVTEGAKRGLGLARAMGL
jgi:hypothetical protein